VAQLVSPQILMLVRAMSRIRSNTSSTPRASIGRPIAVRMMAMATSDADGTPATPMDVSKAIATIENCTPKVSSRP